MLTAAAAAAAGAARAGRGCAGLRGRTGPGGPGEGGSGGGFWGTLVPPGRESTRTKSRRFGETESYGTKLVGS